MRNVPVPAITMIVFGVIIFLWPNLVAYLVALYLVVAGILQIMLSRR